MPADVLMPQLSPTMTEGRFAKWVKKEGDAVNVGDIIAEIETDKATMEVEATEDGVLAKLYAEAGKDVPVGAPIAVIVEDGEDLPADYKPTSREVKAEEPKEEPKETKAAEAPKAEAKKEEPKKVEAPKAAPTPVASTASSSGIKASPLAKRLAAEWGIPLSNIRGTGPHGRIVKEDVDTARANGVRKVPMSGGSMPAFGNSGFGGASQLEASLTPHSKMREVIAARLVEAKQSVPHFYLTVDVMMDEALKAREALNNMAPKDAEGKPAYKLSVNDMIVKASALALRQHPDANASWTDEGLQKYGSVDVSVAVSIEGGLITPILKNVENRSMVELSTEMKDLAGLARAGKLKPEQYQGGTFSVSNLGMFGIKHFDAIINPPQSCILACGTAEKRPVVGENGELKAANVMTLTLSVDHRVVDGALGAEVLTSIKQHLENPITLVV